MDRRSPVRVVLSGEESAGVQALRTLLETDAEVVAVLTSEHAEGRTPALFKAAVDAGIETWPAGLVRKPLLADRLRDADVDVLLNVHSLHIVCDAVLQAPRVGCFNLHPGPLPRYAGLNSVSWALLRGETEHGVTLHWMEPEIDAGHIAGQVFFPIEDGDTPIALTSTCARLGAGLIEDLIARVAERRPVPRQVMDASKREYFGREVPFEGRIEWRRPADELARFVRACDYGPFPSPWGWPRARWRDAALEIVAAVAVESRPGAGPGTVVAVDDGGLVAACGEGALRITRARWSGRRARLRELAEVGDVLGDGAV